MNREDLHPNENGFRDCIDKVKLTPLHPKADRGFKVVLVVSSGQVMDARVVSAPPGLKAKAKDCLVRAFSQLTLPGVGLSRPESLEAVVELPIAGSDQPILPDYSKAR